MTSPDQHPPENQPSRRHHWLRFILSLIVLILVVWGAFRACSDAGVITNSKPYIIAQQRISNAVYVPGKERNAEAFFRDVVYKVASDEDINIRMITVSPNLALLGLGKGDYDAIITTIIPDPATLRTYEFSEPLYQLGAVLIVKSSSGISSLKQMEGKVIGIPREESTFFDVGVYPELIFYSYEDEIDALEDLERGQLDGVIMNAWPAYVLTKTLFEGRLKVATEPFTDDGIRIATLRGSRFSKEIPKINKGLNRLREDGTFEDLLNKWGLVSTQFWEDEHSDLIQQYRR